MTSMESRGIRVRVRRDDAVLQGPLKDVKLKLVVISGKGGVGKSFIATSLALGFALRGYKSGILDADIYGPTVPKMLGISAERLRVDEEGKRIIPAVGPLGVKVVSIDFLLPSDDVAIIWRAPLMNQAIMEFLSSVEWGSLDVLVVDLPPGTGDAPLTIAQQLKGSIDGAVLVTIPSLISKRIVAKCIDFARKLDIPIAGIVENMCCFYCPDTGKPHYIFGRGIGERMAEEYGVEFLGGVPLDPQVSEANDLGQPPLLRYPTSKASEAIMAIVDKLIDRYRERLG